MCLVRAVVQSRKARVVWLFVPALGDEDNHLGHRGFAGISGWGWMSYVRGEQIEHVEATDWLFTVVVPTPDTAGVLGLAALARLRWRR